MRNNSKLDTQESQSMTDRPSDETIKTSQSKKGRSLSEKPVVSDQTKSASSIHSASSGSSPAATMAELMRSSSASVYKPIQKGDIVEGIIKKLTPREILMEIGAKGDALVIEFDKINLENLLSLLKVGDCVKASVISAESEEGFPVVSLRRTLDDLIFGKYENLVKKNEPLSVLVSESTRGGYFVEGPFGVRGFLPNSQILSEKDMVNRPIEVKIIELDRNKKRVIFSQKATVYTTDQQTLDKHVKKGTTVDATVTTVTPYGLYVTVTPERDVLIEGFIHISEISYDRVENLSALYKVGDSLKAQVLDIDTENRRVNLSLKSLLKDTFEEVQNQYKREQKVKGTVKDIKTRGITIELAPHVSGFISGNKVPTDVTYAVGDQIEVEVTDFDAKRRLVLVSPVLKKTFVGYR